MLTPCTWHAHPILEVEVSMLEVEVSILEVEVSMLEVEVSMLEVVGWEDLPFANWCGLRSYDSKLQLCDQTDRDRAAAT